MNEFSGFEKMPDSLNKQGLMKKRFIQYGKLFAGKYPHSGMITVENVQAIQTEVYYMAPVSIFLHLT